MMRHDDLPDPSALLASLLSLMTGFVRTGSPLHATLISRQIAYLHYYPDSQISPLLKSVARRVRSDWEQLRVTLPGCNGANGLSERVELR
jgi:hypothetical protein